MNSHSPNDPGRELAHRLRLACEAHEVSITGHLARVAHYSCELAARLGLPEHRIEELRLAAPLHDLGKVGVPTEMLTRKGALTAAEMEVMRSHTVVGHKILEDSPWPVMQCAARIALSHHEHWDGGGYPQGLRGTAIPLEARIVAVADVFDALVSERSYKSAWETDRALAELQEKRGTWFDPEIVDVLVRHLAEITAGTPEKIAV